MSALMLLPLPLVIDGGIVISVCVAYIVTSDTAGIFQAIFRNVLMECMGDAGGLVHQHSGANKVKMEDALQKYLLPEENPMAQANAFQRQVWHAKLGIS